MKLNNIDVNPTSHQKLHFLLEYTVHRSILMKPIHTDSTYNLTCNSLLNYDVANIHKSLII